MIVVERGDPRDPGAAALLRQSHSLMESLFPPEENAHLDIDALCGEDITFLVARRGPVLRGTGAIADKGDYAELKSIFVDPDARGQGIADALMRALEDEARGQGKRSLKLETGDLLSAARKLYERHGFTYCDPFGDYQANSSSMFMHKDLVPL